MKQTKIITFNIILLFVLLIGASLSLYNVYEQHQRSKTEYQFIVNDDSITVYDGNRTVGTVLLEGDLDGLIIMDNQ